MSNLRRELKPIRRPSVKQEAANMNDALAQMRRSGSIYFLKSLPRTAIQRGEISGNYAELTLPAQFIQENCDKIEEWVILRVHLSCGRSSRPWLVRLRVDTTKTFVVRIAFGWHSFVADNRLKEGDSLIFLLKEDARSEFEVHVFRGPQPGSPHFPHEVEDSPIDEEDVAEEHVSDSEEEENSKQSRFPSPGHDHVELNKAFAHSQHLEKRRAYPGFRKRLTASNMRGSNGDRKTGQFHIPWSFVKTHGDQVQGSVQLQGIHENSPTYSVTFRRCPPHSLRVSSVPSEWCRFVKENGLKEGHELQFSLIDESYFAVRKV